MKIVEFDEGRVILHVQDPAFLDLKGSKAADKAIYYKKMMYVYTVSDYNATPFREGYDERRTHEYALDVSKLPRTFMPDRKTGEAIKAYFKLRDSIPVHYLRQLYRSMSTAKETVKMLNDINKDLLSQAAVIDSSDPASLKDKSNLISTIANNQNILFDMASKAQEYVAKVKSLIKDINDEEEKIERGFGDGEITDSMIPDEY